MHSAIWAPATCVLSRSLTSKKPIGCPGGVSARHAERHFAAEPTRERTRQELMAKRSSILERQEFLEKRHRFLTWVLWHRFFDSTLRKSRSSQRGTFSDSSRVIALAWRRGGPAGFENNSAPISTRDKVTRKANTWKLLKIRGCPPGIRTPITCSRGRCPSR